MQETIEASALLIQPSLFCNGSNAASYFCLQQLCKNRAICCIDENCECQKNHEENCGAKVRLKNILNPIYQAKNSPQLSKAIKSVQKIFEDLLEMVSIQRQKSIKTVEDLIFKDGQTQLLSLIQDSKIDQINGSLIYKIYASRKNSKPTQFSQKINDQSLQICSKKSTAAIKKCCFDIQKQFSYLANLMRNKFHFESKVLEKPQQIAKIQTFFDKKIIDMKLQFRASQHQFSGKKFNQACNGIQNTLIVITTEKMKKIGGFCALPWGSKEKATLEKQKQCFVFSLTNGEKFQCRDPENAILYYASSGPTFGKSTSDIYIPDKANSTSCNFNIGNSYGKLQLANMQNRFKEFSGTQSGYQCKILQYEVFILTFEVKK